MYLHPPDCTLVIGKRPKEKRNNEKIAEIDKLLSLEIISKEEAERRKNDIID